ncbi:MAG TPA: GAF domain-containing protein [Acidimicrobiia bacterium]|nr:GAF domain-containing protein [Acidimicrobiia bacterium]
MLTRAYAEVSAALNSTLELDDVLDLILDRLAGVVPFSRGTIMIADEDHLEVVRAKGFQSEIIGLRLPLADVPNLNRVVRVGESSLINDVESSSEWTKTPATEDVMSNMTAPIRAGGRVVGAVAVDSELKSAFTPELMKRLEGFADQAGNAIRNAQLYQESKSALIAMREQRRMAQILTEISGELINQRDVDAVLDFILDRISGFAAGAAVSVTLIEDGVAEVVRSTVDAEALVKRMIVSETPIFAELVDSQRSMLIEDTRASSGWERTREADWIRSYLMTPIRFEGLVVGFVSLMSDQPRAFPPTLVEPLEAFSTQVGIAIHNAGLFAASELAREAEHDQRLFVEALAEVSVALNSTLELDDVLDLILDRVGGVVPFTRGSIMLADDGYLEVARAKGFHEPIVGLRLSLDAFPNLSGVIRTGESSLINDIESSSQWTHTPGTVDLLSNMTAAIRAGGRVVGAIAVDSETKGAFTVEMVKRLEAFAAQAGNAIRNARLYQESEAARNQADSLLRAILPDQIAEELKTTDRVEPRRHEDVAVLFADVVGFTEYSDRHDPEVVLGALEEIVTLFEGIAERHGLEKIKTIGDSFMAVSGLLSPVMIPDLQCVKAGLDMIAACQDLGSNWTVRVGIHSGELVSGVLGSKKFSYDVWGDTVNTAARLQSSGIPAGVCVSRTSWNKVAHVCHGQSRGNVTLKGKGDMEVYVVEALR